MKAFKFIAFGMTLVLLHLLPACSSENDEPIDEPTPEVVEPVIKIDSSIITNGLNFTNEEGEQSISFTTTEDWTLDMASTRSAVTWCKASQTSGTKGNATIIFNTTENRSYDDRGVRVTLRAGQSLCSFTISQKALNAIVATKNKHEVSQEGGTIEIEVRSNIDYKLEISENAKEWINESSSRALTANKHTLTISSNWKLEKREGEVYVKSGNKTETIKIYQSSGAIILLSQNEYIANDAGEVISVDIKSNIDFGVQMPNVSWITEDTSSRSASSHTLRYIVSANEEYERRSAAIVFYDKNSESTDTFKVTQVQKDAIIYSQKGTPVGSEGGTIEVKIGPNIDFDMSIPNLDWIEKSNSSNSDKQTICFKIAENKGDIEREAEITFTNKSNKQTETLKIKQDKIRDSFMLPYTDLFNSSIRNYLNSHTDLTKIRFVAKSDTTSSKPLDVAEAGNGIKAYLIPNGEWLEIHTSAKDFVTPQYCGHMFEDMTTITEIDLGDNFNTSETTEIDGMFKNCTNLVSVDLSCINTSKITNLNGMFMGCNSLQSLDLSNFDTSNVTNMSWMFHGCEKLKDLDLSHFHTEKVVDLSMMFVLCKSLTSLDLSSFDTSKVNEMICMFEGCENLEELDISSFNTENVTDMRNMFYSCKSLKSLDISRFNTENVDIMLAMFYGCEKLEKLDLSNFNTSNVTDMGAMFGDCKSLTNLNISNFDTSNVTDMNGMFLGCQSLTSLKLDNFDTSKVTNMFMMFNGCNSLVSIDLGNFNTTNVKNMSCMFIGCSSLTSLDLKNFNTSNIEDMSLMFSECESLTNLDISNFDTSNVTEMSSMFNECKSLTSLNLENFDTSKVTGMGSMFYECNNLESLNISNFNTSCVTNMAEMFSNCKKLVSLDLNHFNTSNVTYLAFMFKGCESLTYLNINKFNTEKLSGTWNMFEDCQSLNELDLTSFTFNFTEYYNYSNMFKNIGIKATNQPIPIKVTEEGYTFLIKGYKTTGLDEYYIGTSAKFVKPDGTAW